MATPHAESPAPSPASKGWLYHPLEIVVRPGSSDSALAGQLAIRLSATHRVGLVRHGEGFSANPEAASGLVEARAAGVWGALAANGQECLFVRDGHFDLPFQKTLLADADLVVVEGSMESVPPAVVELQPNGEGFHDLAPGLQAGVMALVGPVRPTGKMPSGGIPWFAPSDLDALADHLLDRQDLLLRARPVWGLALLPNPPQHPDSREVLQILADRCPRVFVASNHPDAWADARVEQAPDLHPGWGDLGRILSCLERHSSAAFLVMGCAPDDLRPGIVDSLLRQRNPYRAATVFREAETHLPQRTPSLWEPKSRTRIHHGLAADIRCPQRILAHSHVQLVER